MRGMKERMSRFRERRWGLDIEKSIRKNAKCPEEIPPGICDSFNDTLERVDGDYLP